MGSYGWGSDTSADWTGGGMNYGSVKKAYDDDKGYKPTSKSCEPSLSVDMKSAYSLSSRLINLAAPAEEKSLLSKLDAKSILVVPGQYDHVEQVLHAAGTPYSMISSSTLNPKQVVLVNCPGTTTGYHYNGRSGVAALTDFVNDGGFLVTTDWGLTNVVMKAFPGHIEHGGRDTANDMVEVDLIAKDSPYTKGLGGGSLKMIWWLEGSSYPIRVIDRGVDVLLGSEEMKTKYGESPVAVKFPFGEGRVIHVTSHFHLQTTKTKYEAQAQKSGLDFATKYLGFAAKDAKSVGNLDSVAFGAVESAYTSLRFLHNIFIEKLKKNEGTVAPKGANLLAGKSVRALPPGKLSKKLIADK